MEATERIRVTVSRKEARELEISFPYYVKSDNGCVLIKFFDRRKGIMVTDYSFSKSIEYMQMPEGWLTFNPATKEEFNAKFNYVMTALIDKNNEKTI